MYIILHADFFTSCKHHIYIFNITIYYFYCDDNIYITESFKHTSVNNILMTRQIFYDVAIP
jgi:hypothetical protein